MEYLGQLIFTETVENAYDYSDSVSKQKVTFSGKKYPQYLRLLKCHAYKHPDSVYSLHMYMEYGVWVRACSTNRHTRTQHSLKLFGLLTNNILPFHVSGVILVRWMIIPWDSASILLTTSFISWLHGLGPTAVCPHSDSELVTGFMENRVLLCSKNSGSQDGHVCTVYTEYFSMT